MAKKKRKDSMKTIMAKSNKTDEELQQLYQEVKEELEYNDKNLDAIFSVALLDREVLFPNLKKDTEADYIKDWINRYKKAMEQLPSKHIGAPKKTCSDPSLSKIVMTVCDITDEEVLDYERKHNLFMAAENIQGDLLEEYISENVAPFGWAWCAGEILAAADFCKTDGSAFLQIKNKDNTENSSSSKIRNGTEIKKANRLRTRIKNGKPYADYEWEKINDIINEGLDEENEKCVMSEEKYQEFLTEVVTNNPKIVSVE